MTDFDPFGDFEAPEGTQPVPGTQATQPETDSQPTTSAQQEVVEEPVPEPPKVQAPADPLADLVADAPVEEKPTEPVEEAKDSMFGQEQEEQAPLPQEQEDLNKYNELQRKYQQHLLAKEDEQANQATQLETQATDYRVDWKRKQEEFSSKQTEKQKQEWDDTQKMIKDDKIGSWQKIGKLSGTGEGRQFEVLQLKIQDEKEELDKKK